MDKSRSVCKKSQLQIQQTLENNPQYQVTPRKLSATPDLTSHSPDLHQNPPRPVDSPELQSSRPDSCPSFQSPCSFVHTKIFPSSLFLLFGNRSAGLLSHPPCLPVSAMASLLNCNPGKEPTALSTHSAPSLSPFQCQLKTSFLVLITLLCSLSVRGLMTQAFNLFTKQCHYTSVFYNLYRAQSFGLCHPILQNVWEKQCSFLFPWPLSCRDLAVSTETCVRQRQDKSTYLRLSIWSIEPTLIALGYMFKELFLHLPPGLKVSINWVWERIFLDTKHFELRLWGRRDRKRE
jgi:hypothetical protein